MSKAARAALIAVFGVVAASPAPAKDGSACPDVTATADRLVLVLASGLNTATAKVLFFEKQGGAWRAEGGAKAASLGGRGMAWSWAAKAYATDGEPVKTEGDGRSPAGFFRIGEPFGLTPRNVPRYTALRAGQHYCVDDLRSPLYNTIVPKASAAGMSGEDMGTIALYRQGLFVDYPTSREAIGGSCIFVHVWRRKDAGTAGCVAMAERDVTAMQDWSQAKPTAIGILPETAWKRLRGCFPGL